jgi:hypothetical protein
MKPEFKKAADVLGKRRLMRNEVKEIIDMTTENEQLKTEAGNLMFVAYYEIQERGTELHKEWNYGLTSCHKKHRFDYIVAQIRELLEENKKLKEELVSKMNQTKMNEIHNQNKFFAPDQPGRGRGV